MVSITAFIQAYPHLSIILISLLVTLFVTIVNYLVLDKERMREIKRRQKEIQQQMKKHQQEGNHDKMMELNKELLSQTKEMMTHSFKPMLFTIIPILLLFSVIRGWYAETTIASTWFWYYIGASIVGSIVFRKLFKLP